MEQYNSDNIRSTLICEFRNKCDCEDKVNNLNVEDEYEIINIPKESIIKRIAKTIPIAPPRPPMLKFLEPLIRLRIRKPKSTIPVPPPRPLMDFEKKNIPVPPPRPLMDFEKKNIPVPPPRPLMDFEKKNIPIPPPRPLMDFEKKNIPIPPPRPLMDFEKKSIPVPPPRPLMDFEKKSIPVPPPRPLMDFEKKSIPVPPPRPLMDFEKKSIPVPPPRPLMDFEKKSIPVPPPRPLMDFEKKSIPVPPPRPLMDFEKKSIPVPPPRPLMDFEKKSIPVPPPRPLMDFEKKSIPVPPPRPLMDFEKKSIPVPPPRPLMDFEKKSIPVPPPRPLMDFEKKSIPVPPPRPLMDFEKKSIPVPPPRPLMDFEKKTTKQIKFKVEDEDDDFTFVPMMVEKTAEYSDEIINAHEKVMNELMNKTKKTEKTNKKMNSMLSAPTKMNNHCLLMYEIKNFKNKLNSVNSSIKENKMTPSTLKDMLLYEIKNHKINLKKTQEPVIRSNLNSRGYMAWELQNSNLCKNISETKKECKKVEKEMPKSLSPMQQIIWEIKNRNITLKKTTAITKKEAPLKLSFPEQLVLEIKNHRPLRKVALEDIPKAIGGTRVSNEKDISLELLNKTANDVCNQSREKVYIVQQARQRLTSDDQYAKLLCSIKKFKKCGEENDEDVNSSDYTKKYTNPMKSKYYGNANSNKNIWWDEEHKKIMRSIRRRNFSLRSIEDEVWVYVPPNHPAEKQKKSRFWLW